jgi:hypothetical protein
VEVSGDLHSLATLPLGEELAVLICLRGWLGLIAGLAAVIKRKISFPAGNQMLLIQPIV